MATSDTRPTQDADAGLADELEREFARAMASQEYDPAAVIGGPRPVVDAPDAVERVAAALAKADGYKWFSAADEGQYFLKRSQDIYRKRARAALAALPVQPGERERFLLAYVSQDAKVVGIEHDTDADWHEVQRAHEVLRDRLNERLAERDNCPFKPSPTPRNR